MGWVVIALTGVAVECALVILLGRQVTSRWEAESGEPLQPVPVPASPVEATAVPLVAPAAARGGGDVPGRRTTGTARRSPRGPRVRRRADGREPPRRALQATPEVGIAGLGRTWPR